VTAGRRALVTGASSGIGREVARGLAARGYETVLAVRNRGRGEAASRDIAASTRTEAPAVLLVDFSEPASIRAFADEAAKRYSSLDVLVNNAGIWSTRRRETREGRELVWATNQLGYFLTTQLLLPLLRAAPEARIVNVASGLAMDLDLEDVEFKRRPYTAISAYAQSKQANRMWTRALARRLAGTSITANSLDPGGVATAIVRKGGGFLARIAGRFGAGRRGKTPAEGAETPLWLAASEEASGRTGLFFSRRQEKPCRFVNEAEEERLYDLCARMTGGG